MWTVAEANLIPILLAVLIGFATGWWIFSARFRAPADRSLESAPDRAGKSPPPAQAPRPTPIRDGVDTQEPGRPASQRTAAAPAHAELPSPGGAPEDLQTMKGVGPKLAAQLDAAGITRFDQLAGLDADQAARLDEKMGAFRGRLARDRLVEQAAYLARGDTDGYEARFGKL